MSTPPRNALQEANPDLSGDQLDGLRGAQIGFELEFFCENILFLSSFAFGGILTTEASYTAVGSEIISYGNAHLSGIDCDSESYRFLSGPILPPSDLDIVLNWSKRCGGVWVGLASANVEKATAFLSHAMECSAGMGSVTNIIWVTAGLEALACENSNSIVDQLKRRLPQICTKAPFNDLKRLIRDAYDFRSRLFHGDIALHSRFNPDDVHWSNQRYDARMEHFGLALKVMLMSALWYCVSLNGTSIVYEESPKIS